MKDRTSRPPSAMDYVGGLIFGIIVLIMVLGCRLFQIVTFPLWYPLWFWLKPRNPDSTKSNFGGSPSTRSPCW